MFTLSVWVLGPMCVSLGALVCEPWGPCLRALGPMCMSLGAHVCQPWGPCVCVCVSTSHQQILLYTHPVQVNMSASWRSPRLYCMYAIQVFSFSDPCHYICIQSFIWLDPDHGSRPLNQVLKKLSYHFAFLFITLNFGNVSDRIAGPWQHYSSIAGPWQHYSSIVTMTTL